MIHSTHIQKAIEVCGSQEKLAARVGVSQVAVSKWLRGGDIDPRRAPLIEEATGGVVSRADLFPDLWPPDQPDLNPTAAHAA